VSVDGQSKSAYEQMINGRFKYTQDNLADAYAAAARESKPVVLIVGGWEKNNSKKLVESTLPMATKGDDAIFVYIDPAKAKGDIAEFAKRQTAQGHNAPITVVTTVRPDQGGKPVPENYTFRWQGADPSMIRSFREALAEAQTKQSSYRGGFTTDTPPVPKPGPSKPSEVAPARVPKSDAAKDPALAKIDEILAQLRKENEQLKHKLDELQKSQAAAGRPSASPARPADQPEGAPPVAKPQDAPTKVDALGKDSGSASATDGTADGGSLLSDIAKIAGGGAALALLLKTMKDRWGRADASTSTELVPTKPAGHRGEGAKLLPPSELEKGEQIDRLKRALGLPSTSTMEELQKQVEAGVVKEAKNLLKMQDATIAEALERIKSAEGTAALRQALGLRPDASKLQVLEKLLNTHLDKVEIAGPKAIEGPRPKPIEQPKSHETTRPIEQTKPAVTSDHPTDIQRQSTEAKLFGGRYWHATTILPDGTAIVQSVDRKFNGTVNAPTISTTGPRDGLDPSTLKEFKIGSQTYLYEPGNQVVYQRSQSGALQKLDLNTIRVLKPNSETYKYFVGEAATVHGAPTSGREPQKPGQSQEEHKAAAPSAVHRTRPMEAPQSIPPRSVVESITPIGTGPKAEAGSGTHAKPAGTRPSKGAGKPGGGGKIAGVIGAVDTVLEKVLK
jgi:hypothetical protein